MTDSVFPPAPRPCVAIAGWARRFPVRRMFCGGRDHAAHASEPGTPAGDGAGDRPSGTGDDNGTVEFTWGPPQ